MSEPDDRDFTELEAAARRIRTGRAGTLGPVELGFRNLGKAWAAKISEHLGTPVEDLPPDMVCLMLCDLKTLRAVRSGRGFSEDDFADNHNYAGFARNMAKRRQTKRIVEQSADAGGETHVQGPAPRVLPPTSCRCSGAPAFHGDRECPAHACVGCPHDDKERSKP